MSVCLSILSVWFCLHEYVLKIRISACVCVRASIAIFVAFFCRNKSGTFPAATVTGDDHQPASIFARPLECPIWGSSMSKWWSQTLGPLPGTRLARWNPQGSSKILPKSWINQKIVTRLQQIQYAFGVWSFVGAVYYGNFGERTNKCLFDMLKG